MVDVLTSISIKAPLKRVAAFACNPNHAPQWYVNIKTVEWKTPEPLTIGSRIALPLILWAKNYPILIR